MKFGDLKAGDWFKCEEDKHFDTNERELFLKVFGHNLQILVGESMGGHAVSIKTGLLCFFQDFENVDLIEDVDITI
jgi:hypothetical protein